MLFDCTALFFGLFASIMSHWKPTRLYSFGFSKVEVLSGFVNGLFLVVIACFILTEALGRLVDPPHIVTDRLLVRPIPIPCYHEHQFFSHTVSLYCSSFRLLVSLSISLESLLFIPMVTFTDTITHIHMTTPIIKAMPIITIAITLTTIAAIHMITVTCKASKLKLINININ